MLSVPKVNEKMRNLDVVLHGVKTHKINMLSFIAVKI